jgi:hypothetical protein
VRRWGIRSGYGLTGGVGGEGVRHTTASLASGPADKRLERWDVAASGGDWKMAQGARLSPVKGVGAGRAKARWWL